MAATFTEISLVEIETYLRRAFRALKPKKGMERGEITVDLFLNEAATIGVRIFTSVHGANEMAAGAGIDPIRVGFYNFAKGRPMITGKFPIVKRTQGWRDTLKDRVEDYMEMYEEKEEYWESRAGGYGR